VKFEHCVFGSAIDTSSEIAKSMSKHDLEMREKANKERKAKLKNPNYLVLFI